MEFKIFYTLFELVLLFEEVDLGLDELLLGNEEFLALGVDDEERVVGLDAGADPQGHVAGGLGDLEDLVLLEVLVALRLI